ncbi:MAG: cyclic nucleotide-binding domain-containing protein [Planctomycetales bacterium]|nr:cyclic nucleotide-binding domain-containing protein [Planctomycetales bacterium]MCA9219488.1 cyclic nucleotide-binding domain-containing protein [Planctomycetales bacterium]
MTSLASQLRNSGFLGDLPDELLDALAGIGQARVFPDGAIIFRQGDPATQLYLVVDGQVALEICAAAVGCKRVLTVGAGELLGWSPVLEQGRLTATARALRAVKAIEFDGAKLLEVCERNPRLGYEFMRRVALALAKRLSATRLQLVDVYGSQMPAVGDPRTMGG